jgi:hypothetical protein
MSGIKKAGVTAPLTSQQQINTNQQQNFVPTQSTTPTLQPNNINSQSYGWSQFTNNQMGTTGGLVMGNQTQAGNINSNTVFRAQVFNQKFNAENGGMSPYSMGSWRSTGNLQLDQAIDNAVDKMFFDRAEGLGLPQQALGGRRRMGMGAELSHQTSGGGLSPDMTQMPTGLIRAYGTRGQTIAEVGVAALNEQTGFFNVTPGGGIETGYAQATALAARARAYGGIDPYAMAAEFGVEANATLFDLRAGYRTNQNVVDMGFLQVGNEVSVDARLYAGADAYADARISFNNGPRVSVGAGAFAGASAELAMSDTIRINGQTVGGGHVVAKAWAGAGAKLDIDVGFENGKLDFRFDIGAAIGVGLELDFGFSIDFKAAANIVKDTIKSVVGKFLPFLGGGGNQMSAQMQQMMMQMILQQVEQSMKQHMQEMQMAQAA